MYKKSTGIHAKSAKSKRRARFVAIVTSCLLAAGSVVGFSLVSQASTVPEIVGPSPVSVTLGSPTSSRFQEYTTDTVREAKWYLTSADESAGFVIDENDGFLGLTSATASRTVVITVVSGTWTSSRAVNVVVSAFPDISGSSMVYRSTGQSLSQTYTANVDVTWSISGDGSRFDTTATDGVLRWAGEAETTPGVYYVDVIATDSNGETETFSVTVEVTAAAVISGSDSVSRTAGRNLNETYTISNSVPVSWSISGDGSRFDTTATDGVLRWAGEAETTPGVYYVDVIATDSNGETETFSVTVEVTADVTAPTITTDGVRTSDDSIRFTADEDVTWSLGTEGDGTGEVLFTIDVDGFVSAVQGLVEGFYDIIVVARDLFDNISTLLVSFEYVDTTAPEFDFAYTDGEDEIVLVYSETLHYPGSTAAASDFTVRVSGDAGRTIAVTGVVFTYDTVRLSLGSVIASGEEVYVSYDAIEDGIEDTAVAANDAASLVDAVVENYSEGDLTSPTFDTSNPADNATGVPVNTNITLDFSEEINTGNSNLAQVMLKDVTSDTTVSSAITIVLGKVVINPTADLANSTQYYVTWAAGALEDAAGNAVAAVANETTLNFTTAAAPSAGGGGGGGIGIVVIPTPADASTKIHTKVFAVNSSKLNKSMRASILEILSSNKDASSVVCRPVISTSNASAAAKRLARARSVAVCNYISSITSDLDVGVGKSYLVVSNSEQRRTVRITIG